MKFFRRYFGPVSIAILLLITTYSYLNLQGTSPPQPAILDPDFTLWTQTGNLTQPLVWSLESNAAHDRIMADRVTLLKKDALRLSIYQNETQSGDSFISVSETLDGARLTRLMNSIIGLWVFKNVCNCDSNPFGNASELQAVQINDGIRTISFVFTDNLQGTASFLEHRVILIPTPSDQWSYEEVNIGREYAAASWPQPTTITFSLLFEINRAPVGWHSVYFSHITTQAVPQLATTSAVEIGSMNLADCYQTFKVQENLAGAE